MSEEWRIWLYPLGILPLIFFSGRFLIQWLMSEWLHRSVVPRTFWLLSLAGNILMTIHAAIQLQFHVAISQITNGVIAWRNLNLMEPSEKRLSLYSAISIMIISILATVGFFAWEGEWFRSPRIPGVDSVIQLTWGWHLFGTFGIILFSARFWVQWWQAETSQESQLSPAFWWISIAGSAMMLVYFVLLRDAINCIGPLFSLIPYLRNLILLRRQEG